MTICTEHQDLIANTPLIIAGSEKYGKCDTVKRICLIMAYNLLSCKKLKFESLMKPLDKEGKNKGKFRELTTAELKLCTEKADETAEAIRVLDEAIEADERKRIRLVEEALEQKRLQENAGKDADNSCKEIEAINFLKNKPMDSIIEQYRNLHYGDEDALHTVIWGYCVKWLKESSDEGIHIIAVGTRGTGKSHGITTAMSFLPPELTLIKGISARFLYYANNIVRGMTVYLDELPTDQTLIDCLKAIITAYPNGGSRGTVINQTGVEQSIPARVTINTSSVDQTGDEQFTNRMTVIRAKDSKDAKTARIQFRIRLYEGSIEKTNPEKIISIHNALRYLSTKNFIVLLPKAAIEADCYDKIDMRVLNQFYDAMIGNAILNFPSRSDETIWGDEITLKVTKEDFNAVIHLYQDPNHYLLKLTESAVIIKKHLETIYPDHNSVGEISDAVKLTAQTVRNTLIGRKDRNVESLISAGYAEEVSLSDQKTDTYTDSYGKERLRLIGARLSSKVYRATQKPMATESNPVQKGDDSGQANLASIVGMLRWNQEKADEAYKQNQDTTTNQPLVCTTLPHNTTIYKPYIPESKSGGV